jgi:hypothetical protein
MDPGELTEESFLRLADLTDPVEALREKRNSEFSAYRDETRRFAAEASQPNDMIQGGLGCNT